MLFYAWAGLAVVLLTRGLALRWSASPWALLAVGFTWLFVEWTGFGLGCRALGSPCTELNVSLAGLHTGLSGQGPFSPRAGLTTVWNGHGLGSPGLDMGYACPYARVAAGWAGRGLGWTLVGSHMDRPGLVMEKLTLGLAVHVLVCARAGLVVVCLAVGFAGCGREWAISGSGWL